MKARAAAALLLCSWLAGCASLPASPPDLAALRDQVSNTERAFARTMAERDFTAFASFLAHDAVFFDGDTPLIGPQAIKAAWKPLYDGATPPFSWEPATVVVLASGDLAHSSGPVRGPDGKIIARFNSIWRRDGSGVWRVVFDKGCGLCACAKQ